MFKKEDNVYTNNYINKKQENINKYLLGVFSNMAIGLLITFMVSISMAFIFPNISIIFLSSFPLMIGTAVLQFVIIYLMNRSISKGAVDNLNLFYYGFTFLNGMILTYIFFFYRSDEIMFALLSTVIFFGSMSIYGYTTKSDLSKWSSILRVAIISITVISLLMSILGVFFGYRNLFISIILSVATIVVMSLYTAYDIQNIIKLYNTYENNSSMKKVLNVLGAFNLYMNFLIIFQHLLKLISHLRNDRK
jgi:FtsH-binding integral membrane protein